MILASFLGRCIHLYMYFTIHKPMIVLPRVVLYINIQLDEYILFLGTKFLGKKKYFIVIGTPGT